MMDAGNVTTPFGRRPAKLALMRRQLGAATIPESKTANKWQVYRHVCEARTLLGVQDRALAVLNALLSFHPGTELGEGGLVVFPSNAQLSVRAHGISGATLRRSLAALVEAGLITRRDSPNGKRYAHRNRDGAVEQAFGFSLAPLLARCDELALMAAEVAEEARCLRKAREALTICRRDVRKLIAAAIEEGAEGDWAAMEAVYASLVGRLPRSPRRQDVESVLREMALLREEVLNRLNNHTNCQNLGVSDAQDEQHIQNSESESHIESKHLPGAKIHPPTPRPCERDFRATRILPLDTIIRACPQIADYSPSGVITDWSGLLSAAGLVRVMLGISHSAWQEACEAMGDGNASVTVACMLERHSRITSAGGYLRELTARARRGQYSPGPAVMALIKPGRLSIPADRTIMSPGRDIATAPYPGFNGRDNPCWKRGATTADMPHDTMRAISSMARTRSRQYPGP